MVQSVYAVGCTRAGLARTVYDCIFGRAVQFKFRPKVWSRGLSRILTSSKSAIRSSVKV